MLHERKLEYDPFRVQYNQREGLLESEELSQFASTARFYMTIWTRKGRADPPYVENDNYGVILKVRSTQGTKRVFSVPTSFDSYRNSSSDMQAYQSCVERDHNNTGMKVYMFWARLRFICQKI